MVGFFCVPKSQLHLIVPVAQLTKRKLCFLAAGFTFISKFTLGVFCKVTINNGGQENLSCPPNIPHPLSNVVP